MVLETVELSKPADEAVKYFASSKLGIRRAGLCRK